MQPGQLHLQLPIEFKPASLAFHVENKNIVVLKLGKCRPMIQTPLDLKLKKIVQIPFDSTFSLFTVLFLVHLSGVSWLTGFYSEQIGSTMSTSKSDLGNLQ